MGKSLAKQGDDAPTSAPAAETMICQGGGKGGSKEEEKSLAQQDDCCSVLEKSKCDVGM